VRQLLPGAVDVVVASTDASSGQWGHQQSRAGRAPTELFSSYLAEQGVDDERVDALFAELLEDLHAS